MGFPFRVIRSCAGGASQDCRIVQGGRSVGVAGDAESFDGGSGPFGNVGIGDEEVRAENAGIFALRHDVERGSPNNFSRLTAGCSCAAFLGSPRNLRSGLGPPIRPAVKLRSSESDLDRDDYRNRLATFGCRAKPPLPDCIDRTLIQTEVVAGRIPNAL